MAEVPFRSGALGDVRMQGFASRATVAEAWSWIERNLRPVRAETVPLSLLAGRVLAEDVRSLVDVPGFDRAMMDGFAVIAADSAGAGPYHRLPLVVVGEAMPGETFSGVLQRGQAVRIMTGAPLPAGSDAVLPVEKAEVAEDRIYVVDEVTPGKHVACRGEDIAVSSTVFQRGRRLRPQDVGALSSIGMPQAKVFGRPRVRIIITGNEILPAGSTPVGARIADANGPMLESLVRRDGGVAIKSGIVADDPEAILTAMNEDADMVLVSGGSSVGQEDHAPTLLAKCGVLAIHGIAMRPSSPAGMGSIGDRLVFLMPGNPVSCLCAYDFFAGRAIRAVAGLGTSWPYREIRLPLVRKLVSLVGRVDYAREPIVGGGVEPLAIGGASILTSTTRADGFVVVPSDSEGYPEGTEVSVWRYD